MQWGTSMMDRDRSYRTLSPPMGQNTLAIYVYVCTLKAESYIL
jgi:hypothetical protein